jgi:hypothetical protein
MFLNRPFEDVNFRSHRACSHKSVSTRQISSIISLLHTNGGILSSFMMTADFLVTSRCRSWQSNLRTNVSNPADTDVLVFTATDDWLIRVSCLAHEVLSAGRQLESAQVLGMNRQLSLLTWMPRSGIQTTSILNKKSNEFFKRNI